MQFRIFYLMGVRTMNFIETLFHLKTSREVLRDALDINSIEQFNEVLKSERFCSDRINEGFSLVLFDFSNADVSSDSIRNFVVLMKSKIRNYNEIGWFDENHIALLLPETSPECAKKVVNKISVALEHVNYIPKSIIINYPTQQIDFIINQPGDINIDINPAIADGYIMPLWKRAFDVIISLTFLIILSPLMLLTAFFIKIVSPGSVFFRQERVGQAGRIFNLLKFRTMNVNNDDSIHREYLKKLMNCNDSEESPMIKIVDIGNDNRIIMFGKIIRKSSIDELPQFINVFLGDMSLVGPRPCIPYEAEEFLHWHKQSFDIVPGITGLWQVSGNNKTTFKEMIRHDIEYATNRSFLLDLKIILKTPGVIIGQVFESFYRKFENKSQQLYINLLK